jgi:G3E family GTPase
MKATTVSHIFAAVGPFGAGKTSLTVATLRSLTESGEVSRERCAYIVNDEGGIGNVDGSVASAYASVMPMVNGCFTCSDEADLRRTLDALAADGMEWIFVEGFGIVSGDETKNFLSSAGYPFQVVCVVDVLHLEQNRVRYGAIMESQMKAATVGIALTKYPPDVMSIADERLDGVIDYIEQHASGKRVFLLPEGDAVPRALLGEGVVMKSACHHSGCSHGHHDHHAHPHDHEGHHDHHHDEHGMALYSYPLATDATFAGVQQAFHGTQKFVPRVKGACDGRLFNRVHETWTQTLPDERGFVTFYATRPVSLALDLPDLAQLIVSYDEPGEHAESYQLMRRESGTREETIREIRRLMEEIPASPQLVLMDGALRLITHPEPLQILKEVARRGSVRDEWFPRALYRCVQYWLAAATVLREQEEHIAASEVATNKRELAVSITWWLHAFPAELGQFREEAESLRLADMAAEGVLSLGSLNSDPERAYWQQLELCRALSFSTPNKDRNLLLRALNHAQQLGGDVQVWQTTRESI